MIMKFLAILIIGMVGMTAHAQTWNEFFKQKKTQKRYLVKQITLLKVYLGYVKEGYDIASSGLTTIHNIKNGDFNLHQDFFASLKNVNPNIRNSSKVADIIAVQIYVVKNIRKINNFCKDNPHFTPEEIRYVSAVYSNMLYLSDLSISELHMIIRANETEMKDDERLMRIDKIYTDMLDTHAFVQSFEKDVYQIASERERERNAIDAWSKQYEII